MSITIWTDGSSRGNPGPGGFGAVVRTKDLVVELGGREDRTTNNRMEIMAAIRAIEWVKLEKLGEGISIYTDSKYLIQGITNWIAGWKKNGWKTAGKKDVENQDLWRALEAAVSGMPIAWKYVEGHAGHPGNERCDDIATSFADTVDPHLYIGPRNLYTIDLDAPPKPTVATKKRSSSAKVHSYVSLVDGIFDSHKTWADCEARVKGVKGARFKKALSQADEEAIKKEWGI